MYLHRLFSGPRDFRTGKAVENHSEKWQPEGKVSWKPVGVSGSGGLGYLHPLLLEDGYSVANVAVFLLELDEPGGIRNHLGLGEQPLYLLPPGHEGIHFPLHPAELFLSLLFEFIGGITLGGFLSLPLLLRFPGGLLGFPPALLGVELAVSEGAQLFDIVAEAPPEGLNPFVLHHEKPF